jgi:ubiquinone/menaquinone biosynthesis C-methylase UbiE
MKTVDSKHYNENYFRHSGGGKSFFDGKIDSIYYSALERMGLEKVNPVILDAGCGRGDLIKVLSQEYPHSSLIGVDYSEAAVKIAQDALKGEPNIRIVRTDISSLPFEDNSIDYIFCLDIVEHLYQEHLEKAVKEMARVLRPGGKILIHTFPVKYMNEVSHFILKLFGRDSIGQQLHVNTQSSFSVKKLLSKSGLSSINIRLEARGDIAEDNIDAPNDFVKKMLVLFDKAYVILSRIFFFSPVKDLIYSDIWATAVKDNTCLKSGKEF